MHGITCKDLIEFLDDYLNMAQPADVRAAFEHHLAMCPYCVDYIRTYEQTVKLGKSVFSDPNGEIPASVPEDLVAAVLQASRRRGN